MPDSLGDRMKRYENTFKLSLPWRLPIILRLDGKAFHTLTRHTEKPFDVKIIRSMDETACRLMSDIQGAELAYIQSDEISILIYPWKNNESQPWFANEVQKMVSVSAGIASAMFTEYYGEFAIFDSRAFILPEIEVVNYFIWRQQDWIRNSVQMLAQSLFSQKQLNGKKCEELKAMCKEKGQEWDALATPLKYGRCATKVNWHDNKLFDSEDVHIDENIPIFKDYRDYISVHLPTVTKANFEDMAQQDQNDPEEA